LELKVQMAMSQAGFTTLMLQLGSDKGGGVTDAQVFGRHGAAVADVRPGHGHGR
jgi:hypothetical protein